jgi:hypothetical protein
LRSEKDVQITKPVKIQHPTNLVLLPVLRRADDSKQGELWQLTAEGGSGYYQWTIGDPNIASISGSGLVKSVDIGQTVVTVRDTHNLKNSHQIQVEVTAISSFGWLEDHIEVKKNEEETTINLIAFDKNGRKFTNCTAIDVSYDLKGAGIVTHLPYNKRYEDI